MVAYLEENEVDEELLGHSDAKEGHGLDGRDVDQIEPRQAEQRGIPTDQEPICTQLVRAASEEVTHIPAVASHREVTYCRGRDNSVIITRAACKACVRGAVQD